MENTKQTVNNRDFCELLGKNIAELRELCLEHGLPAYKGGILFKWLQAGELDYNQMSNLSKAERALLQAHFPQHLPDILREQRSADGATAKLLLDFGGGSKAAAVILFVSARRPAAPWAVLFAPPAFPVWCAT